MATTVDSPTDNNNLATDASPVAQRATKAKATIDKHESILFKIKLQDATGKHVPVYEVANKTIGFLCGNRSLLFFFWQTNRLDRLPTDILNEAHTNDRGIVGEWEKADMLF